MIRNTVLTYDLLNVSMGVLRISKRMCKETITRTLNFDSPKKGC